MDYNTCPELNGSNEPCETNEELYPIRYNRYSYVSDREGAGKYRGSVALVREGELLADEATLSLRVERQRTGPYGITGGQAGTPLQAVFNPHAEARHVGKVTLEMKRGDIIQITTAGAGGWGDPLQRDVKMVLEDVRNEKLSIKRARDAYGVVIKENLEIDEEKTKALRAEKQNEAMA